MLEAAGEEGAAGSIVVSLVTESIRMTDHAPITDEELAELTVNPDPRRVVRDHTPLTDEELAELERWETIPPAASVRRLIAEVLRLRTEVGRLETTIGFNARDPLGQRVHALQHELHVSRAEVERLRAHSCSRTCQGHPPHLGEPA